MPSDIEGKISWLGKKEAKSKADVIAIEELKIRFEEHDDLMEFSKEDRIIFVSSLLKLEQEFSSDHRVTSEKGIISYTFSEADTELFKLVFQVTLALNRAQKQKFDVKEEMALLLAQSRNESVKKYREAFEEFVKKTR